MNFDEACSVHFVFCSSIVIRRKQFLLLLCLLLAILVEHLARAMASHVKSDKFAVFLSTSFIECVSVYAMRSTFIVEHQGFSFDVLTNRFLVIRH